MQHFLIIVMLFAFLVTDEVNEQKTISSNDKAISVHFPQDVNTDGMQINFYITGSFGGYLSFVPIQSNVWSYEIPTSHEGKLAKTLKLIIYSPNYQVKTFDFPTLDGQKKGIEVKLEPLKTVPFSGRVLISNQLNAEELQLQVSYTPVWQCVFFQLPDCLLGFIRIASVNLEKDGRFKVDLPNFAGDKVTASFGESGEFSFSLQNKQSRKSLFRLNLKDNSKGFGKIQAALSYPNEKVFMPELEK